MITLFDNIDRTFLGPSLQNENPYHYYSRSARKDVSIIRDKFDEWFLEIPNSEKTDLKNRFKKTFDTDFYEHFLFQLFKHLGFTITIHPDLPESTRKPDFLIKKDEMEIYIEAKISKDKSLKEEAIENKKNEFYDSINKIKSDLFLLFIDKLKFKTERQPNTKQLIKFIESELVKLNPDFVTNDIKVNGLSGMTGITYENEDVQIVVKPMPVNPSDCFKGDRRAVGMTPFESFMGGAEDSLKNSIKIKAKRYGKLDKPFIVCINAQSVKTSSGHDIENAIWGTLALAYSDDPKNREEKWVRKRDGVFLDEYGPRLQNLSGVLVTRVFTHNIPSANYWLFEHPFTENKLNFEKLGIKYSFIKDGFINTCLGDNLDQIFKISKDWLKE